VPGCLHGEAAAAGARQALRHADGGGALRFDRVTPITEVGIAATVIQLDVITSFAICGAGAATAAALMRPAHADDLQLMQALRHGRNAFVVIASGLLTSLVMDVLPAPWAQAAMAASTIGGVAWMGWAIALLSGVRTPRWSPWLVVLAATACVAAALPLGIRGITFVTTLGLVAAAALVAWLGRRLVLRPRDLHERLIGGTVAVMLVTGLLRAGYLATWDGPFLPNLLYVPPELVTAFALLYGVLPMVFAMLFLNLVNARLRARLQQRVMTDHLTGAMSRQALAEAADVLMRGSRAAQRALAVMMIDLDHFKSINDRHGHAIGDAVLRRAAGLLHEQLRADALLARYGGEEFLALLPVRDLPAARRVAERMRVALAGAPWAAQVAEGVRVTASFGVALLGSDEALEQAIARADEAMYRAKAGGRNQVQVSLMAA